MREALLAVVCLPSLLTLAHASEVDCNGYRNGMRVRDVITLDITKKNSPACVVPNNVSWDIKKYCNDNDLCTFRAHVARRNGNTYFIDRVTGPVKWGIRVRTH